MSYGGQVDERSQEMGDFDRPGRLKRAANHSSKRLRVLSESDGEGEENRFDRALAQSGCTLAKSRIEILQINVGKLCNLKCHHCHVEAGPDRTEIIEESLRDELLRVADRFSIKTVDLTGGAPEMCPDFKGFVRAFRDLGCEVIVRSNLSILVAEGYEDFVDFFAEQRVRVVASLPCYTEDNVDKQRGDGVFRDSISALKLLNAAGYGVEGSNLSLDLVYNPLGPALPGPQDALERDYKQHLQQNFGIAFNALYAITNLPIGRFYSDLKKRGTAEDYDQLLQSNYNSATVEHLMCRNTLNVSWDGWVYDCDFNQMLELPATLDGRPLHICDFDKLDQLEGAQIVTGNHCFGCTAGAGSSCGGELL